MADRLLRNLAVNPRMRDKEAQRGVAFALIEHRSLKPKLGIAFPAVAQSAVNNVQSRTDVGTES